MTGRIVIVTGLPGSGKTRLLARSAVPGVLIVDDIKRRPRVPAIGFVGVRGFWRVVAHALRGGVAMIADVDFCRSPARRDAERWLRLLAPGVDVQWVFFRNDPSRCRRNVLRRDASARREALRRIEDYAAAYRPPHPVRPVYAAPPHQRSKAG